MRRLIPQSLPWKVRCLLRRKKASPSLQLSHPTRFLSKKDKSGREMIYIDRNQDFNDTVRIFIPSGK